MVEGRKVIFLVAPDAGQEAEFRAVEHMTASIPEPVRILHFPSPEKKLVDPITVYCFTPPKVGCGDSSGRFAHAYA